MIISRLAHVALGVPDVDAAAAFYEEVLGLATVAQAGSTRYLAGGRSSTYELRLSPSEDALLDHFAFAVRGEAALHEARERLTAAGVAVGELDMAADPGLGDGIAFALPDGHVVELVVESDPVGYVSVPAAPARNHRGCGPVAIEHITLLASDIRADVQLAVEQLGFRISESVQAPDEAWRNTHLRAGELHHDLAFLPGEAPAPELHHFCFAVPSVADLVRIADALAARGMRLDSSIGRHVGGNNVFLYFKDPFGNRLEVNTDMARIDAAAPPRILARPVPFDAWTEGRPAAMTAGSPARDGRA